MSNYHCESSLAAELLLSQSSEDEAGPATKIQKKGNASEATTVGASYGDPMLEMMRSFQATMANEFQKLGSRMGKIEGDLKKVKKDHDNRPKENASAVIKPQTNSKAAESKTNEKKGRQLSMESNGVKNAPRPLMSVGKSNKNGDNSYNHNARPNQSATPKVKSAVGDETKGKCHSSFSGITYRTKTTSSKDVGTKQDSHRPEDKLKSILKIPINVEHKGEHSKRYVDISDDSEDSYDEKLARAEPITDSPEVSLEQIAQKAREGCVTVPINHNGMKNEEKGKSVAGYRRMATVTERPRAASYDSVDDLLACLEEIPCTPTPPIPVVSVPKINISKMETALAAAKSASAEIGGSSEIRSRTNPKKVSGGKSHSGPLVIEAPPMHGSRPATGGTAVTIPKSNPSATGGTAVTIPKSNPNATGGTAVTIPKSNPSAAGGTAVTIPKSNPNNEASNHGARDPLRCTKFYSLGTSHHKGKEVCLEGELKRENGVNVPYVSLVLTTDGKVGTRPSKFTLKATTMARMLRGKSFNDVMLALRQLDPGNPSCELSV